MTRTALSVERNESLDDLRGSGNLSLPDVQGLIKVHHRSGLLFHRLALVHMVECIPWVLWGFMSLNGTVGNKVLNIEKLKFWMKL